MSQIADKQEAIFKSALGLIRECGFHGTPMSQVARNAGVATGTIYHYFTSKDQLICDLYDHYRKGLVDLVRRALQDGGDMRGQFSAMWRAVFEFYCENPDLLIFFEQYINSPYNANKQPQDYEDKPLYNWLTKGIASGDIRDIDPQLLLLHLINSNISTAKFQVFGHHKLSDREIDQVIAMNWDAISARDTKKTKP